MYPEQMTKPMAAELENVGFTSLKTPEDVDKALSQSEGTTLLFINSVCGCAASNARPAAIASIQNAKHPKNLLTVFAGVDNAAVAKAREYTFPYPPSSPSIGLFKDGKLVRFIERYMIEGRSAKVVADDLIASYEEFC